MTDFDCLVANRFSATCKKKPSYFERLNPKRYVIRLKESAECTINKATDLNHEIVLNCKKYFKSVGLNENDHISRNKGELSCDCCIEYPKIKDKHTSFHRLPEFYLDRIKESPLICFENDLSMSDNKSISILENPSISTNYTISLK